MLSLILFISCFAIGCAAAVALLLPSAPDVVAEAESLIETKAVM
jgi:hypothetical protein